MKPTDADYEAANEALQPWRDNCSLDEDHLVACAIAKAREEGRESARTIEVTQIWKKGGSECLQFVRVEDVAGMAERARLDEREACAKACESLAIRKGHASKGRSCQYAAVIRARSAKAPQTSKDAL